MNTDQNAALMNRLILLVLSLILVCLVLLVLRAYVKPWRAAEQGTPATEVATAPDEPAPAAEPIASAPPRPVTRPATGSGRTVSMVPSPPTPPVPEGGDDGSVIVRNNSTIDFVGVGVSSSPGLGVSGGVPTAISNREIFGVAVLLDIPKPEVRIDLGPACGKLSRKPVTTRHYVGTQDGSLLRLANVFVQIERATGSTAESQPPLLDQVGCMYEPYVMGVLTGQKCKIRNSDPESHNVHATPKLNTEFNFGQPVKGQVNEKSFDHPEVFVRMKCDVHPWMFAYIGVVNNPWFAVTDTNGVFQLPRGLVSGRYTITATHPKAGALSQQIDFRPGEPKAIEFQFRVPDTAQAQNTGTVLVR